MDKIVSLIKKKKKDTEDVVKQVYAGIKGDWEKLLWVLEPDKDKIAKPGK